MITFVALFCVTQTFREHAVLKGHTSVVSSVDFSPDSQLLATGSRDRTIKIWGVTDAREQLTLEGHADAVQSARFSAIESLIYSIDYKNNMIRWKKDKDQYKLNKSHFVNNTGEIFGYDQQFSGRLAIFSSTKFRLDITNNVNIPYNNICVFDLSKLNIISVNPCESLITSLSFSRDGTLASFGDNKGVIRIFSCDNNGKLVEINSYTCPLDEDGNTASPMAIAFHPKNEYVAFGCEDSKIRLWRWSDAAPYATLVGHDRWIDHVAVSANGELIVSGSADSTVRFWSTKTHKNLQSIRSDSIITSIAISNDNKFVSYGCYNGNVWMLKAVP